MFPEDLFSGNWPAQQALFVEEKAAAIFTLSMFMSQMPPELAEHCVIGPFPQFPEAEYTPKQFAHGSLTYSMNVPKKSWNESPEKQAAIIPVSYTHLDVYKRQIKDGSKGSFSSS